MAQVQCGWGVGADACYATFPDQQALASHVVQHAVNAPERPKKRRKPNEEPEEAEEPVTSTSGAGVAPPTNAMTETQAPTQSTLSFMPRIPAGAAQDTSNETSNSSGSINPPIDVSTSNPSRSEHDSTTVYDTSSKSDSQSRSQSGSQPSIQARDETNAFMLRNTALVQSQLPPPPSPQVSSSNPINAGVEPDESQPVEEEERVIETQAVVRPVLDDDDEGWSADDRSTADSEGISFSGPLSQSGPIVVASIEVGGRERPRRSSNAPYL